jgi:hypothetical protein
MSCHSRKAFALALAAVLATASLARAQQAAPAPSLIDKPAMDALAKMGSYLRTLKTFHVETETTRDDTLDDGQKVQRNGGASLLVRAPDKLRAHVKDDLQDRQMFYDGKTFTLYGEKLGYYAQTPAPATIAQLIDALSDKYDIDIPLADLFLWGTDQAAINKITSAMDVGPSQIDGTACEHYVFRQPDVDWQVWIQQGANPLPRKIVITSTDDDARPEFSSTIKWDLAPAYNDEAFTFYPPKDAYKITFAADRPASGK